MHDSVCDRHAVTIRLIVFDMDDVLCRYDLPTRLDRLAGWSGMRADDIHAAIWASGFEGSSDAGLIDAEAYLRGFGARLGCPLTERDWMLARRAAMTPDATMLALVGELKHHMDVALLTNNGLLAKRTIDAMFPELRPLFGERLFFSAEFGAKKPDPEVFRRLLERIGVEPRTALMVDDKPANIAGAEAAGLVGHVFAGIDGFVARLDTLGILRQQRLRWIEPHR
jgi:putative hydrolase of the HAD superfamily